MIQLMKYTYMLETEKIRKELDKLFERYQKIINDKNATWEELNEARSILFLTGNIYCEEIGVGAIERRLHLLKEKLTLLEFFDLIDKESEKINELRKDKVFSKLEELYRIIKKFKNKYHGGKYYIDEEKFLKRYEEKNPNKELKLGYKGKFEIK